MKDKLFLGFAILLIAGLLMVACQIDDKGNNGKTPLEQGGETEDPEIKDPSGEPVEEEPGETGEKEPLTPEEEEYEALKKLGLGFFEEYGLDMETEKQIIELWVELRGGLSQMDEQRMLELGKTLYEFFAIIGYYGTYNGYVVVQYSPGNAHAISGYLFDDIGYAYSTTPPNLKVWKDGEFFDIYALYKQGLLTREDIINIGENRSQTRHGRAVFSVHFL